jgi:fructokinase
MDIIAVGELLIDFTPELSVKEHRYFANPGGAPCNFLTMASAVGVKTGFIGKVGDDAFGHFLKKVIEEKGIDTKGLVLSETLNTTLAFVHLDENGERSFSFYRKGCADVGLRQEEVDLNLIDEAKLIHFGSLSFTDEPSRSTVLSMLTYAKKQGKWISYDPNYRPSLWENESVARERLLEGLPFADILKVSEEELELLTGVRVPLLGCHKLEQHDIKLICVTLGAKGVFYYMSKGHGYIKGFPSKVVDTTGAGDTFFGATVGQLLARGVDLVAIEPSVLEEILNYANCASSICIERYGGIPAIPTDEEVKRKVEVVHAGHLE